MGHRRTRLGAALIGAGAMTAFASATATATTTATTVAHWQMDEPPGAATMADSSGHGHDGAISDVTLGLAGRSDGSGAYHFDGGSMVRVPHDAELNPGTAPITISAWIRVPANLRTGDYNVIQKGTATASGGAYKLEVFGKSGKKFGFPACAFNGPTKAKNRVYGPVTIADGQWHHVECHLTATQAYAVVDGRSGPVAKRVVPSIANSTDLTIGGKPTDVHHFVGDLDEVTVSIG